jgi:hypothetical protein
MWIFVKETDRLSNDDLNRYREPIRYLLSRRFSILQSSDQFEVLRVYNSASR